MRVASVTFASSIGTLRSTRIKTLFAGKLGVVQSWKRRERRCPCHPSFPIATAVSAIRFEKPHSLSYQDIRRARTCRR